MTDDQPTPDEIARVMAYVARQANTPTTRVCPQCGTSFESPRGRTWCSNTCKANAWNQAHKSTKRTRQQKTEVPGEIRWTPLRESTRTPLGFEPYPPDDDATPGE